MRFVTRGLLVCSVLVFTLVLPAAADEKEMGLTLLKWAGGRLGGTAADLGFSYLMKETGLGGSDPTLAKLAEVQQKLGEISNELNKMQNQAALNQEAVLCKIDEGTYQNAITQHNNTFSLVTTVAGMMKQLSSLKEPLIPAADLKPGEHVRVKTSKAATTPKTALRVLVMKADDNEEEPPEAREVEGTVRSATQTHLTIVDANQQEVVFLVHASTVIHKDDRAWRALRNQILAQANQALAAPLQIHDLAVGLKVGSATGLIDSLSNRMKQCSTFIDKPRLKAIKEQYDYLATLQVASCAMVMNYYGAFSDLRQSLEEERMKCAGYVKDLASKAITHELPGDAVYEHAAKTLWRFGPFLNPRKFCWRKWQGGEVYRQIPGQESEEGCQRWGWVRERDGFFQGPADRHAEGVKRILAFEVRRYGVATHSMLGWSTPKAHDVLRIIGTCKGENGQAARDCLNGRGFIDDGNKGEFFFWVLPDQIVRDIWDSNGKDMVIVNNKGEVFRAPCDTCGARMLWTQFTHDRFVW